MEKIYFTADTHFGSERTLKFSRRPFQNTQEMDDTILQNWNETIGENDIVYHLGDFGNYENVKELKGKIVLVLGNYEEEDLKKNYNGNFEAFAKKLQDLGFAKVVRKGLFIDLNGEKIYLTHKPTDCNTEYFNLFGHIHEKNFVKKFGMNIGIDQFHFKPASTDDVLFYKNAIENYYDEDVFCENL